MTSTDNTPIVAITGATAGLGLATMKLLAARGARLVLLTRHPEAATAAASDAGANQVDVIPCDLSLMSSVRQAAADLAALGRPIDVMINDAAIVTSTRILTAEGNETMLATNYLGPALLTRLILDALPADHPVKLIAVGGPLNAVPDLDDLDSAQSFATRTAFERSKTALNLFTAAVPRHVGMPNLRAVIYSPGLMKTNLSATIASSMVRAVGTLATKMLPNPAERAEGLAELVASTNLDDAAPGTLFSSKGEATPMPLIDDIDLQDKLWVLTSQRLGLT